MISLPLALLVAVEEEQNLEWVGTAVTSAGLVLVALVGAVATVWRRVQDRKEKIIDIEAAKTLSEKDEYDEVRQARAEATRYYNLYRLFQNLFYTVQDALRHLARSVREHHPDMEFEPEVIEALALKAPPEDAQ